MAACTGAANVFNAAGVSTNTTAQQLAYDAGVLCSNVGQAIQANNPALAPTANANSVNWLGTVVQDILPLVPVAASLL